MKLVINRRKIEELRIEAGLGMKQLQKATGICGQTLYTTIYGDTIPFPGTLKKIADALNVKVLDIVSIEEGYDETRKRPGRKRKAAVNE